MASWLELFFTVFGDKIAESLQEWLDHRTNGEPSPSCTTTAATISVTPEDKSIAEQTRRMKLFFEQQNQQRQDEEEFLSEEERMDLYFYKALTPEAAQKIINERKEKAKKEEAERLQMEIIQTKVQQEKERRKRIQDEYKYLSNEEYSALSEEEKQFLVQKRKTINLGSIWNDILLIDTCFWEKSSTVNYLQFFDLLLEYCKKNSYRVTLLPDVYHEIINHSNEDKETDENKKEETRFRGRSAKKEIERFQKEDCLIFPDESQIQRNSKYVPAYADNQICEEMQKHIDAEEPCTILTDDRDLRLRVRGMIQKAPENVQDKYKCLSIEDIVGALQKES